MTPTGLETTTQSAPAVPAFDFGADEQTNALLLQDAQAFVAGNMARIMAAKHAHDLCANNKNGTWGKWCEAVGISRDTGNNMAHIAEQFGNIQIADKSIFDVQPLKLLYAAAKPSAPAVLKQAVANGDITSYPAYQEMLAQIKAEKERADTAESRYESAITDVNNLAEANSGLMKTLEKTRKDLRGAQESYNIAKKNEQAQCDHLQDLAKQLEGSRQVAKAATVRAEKYKAEAEAARKQPIEAVVDEAEVERRANQIAQDLAKDLAADMTADLRARMEQDASGSQQDARDAYDGILLAERNIQNSWKMAKPLFAKLPAEQRETLINGFVRTLGQMQGEVSRCL